MDMSATMEFFGVYLIMLLLLVVNYVFSALAIYKIAKVEKVSKPWLAWIPVTNPYLLIKLGGGNLLLLVVAVISLGTGGAVNGFMQNEILKLVGMVATAIWSLYSVYMYSKLCDRYNVGIWYFIIGFIFQLIPSMMMIGVVILLFGYWKLYKSAGSNSNVRRIESRTYHTKGSIKLKKDKTDNKDSKAKK